ncbi:hypothetical protein GGQ13_003030 [Salinibacter ruber]|uniref:hypothetical protein n=1 Tax=Salinibacter ruber TaxID=146919 RepID=UPI00216A5DFE|nr:hypothetical protein [Salinibacter ruber]MCS4139575.1 hypothetical protein [Salinibacter ruber]
MTESQLDDKIAERKNRLQEIADEIEGEGPMELASRLGGTRLLRVQLLTHLEEARALAEKLSEEATGKDEALTYANLAQTLSDLDAK